jgi:hypothetical protein
MWDECGMTLLVERARLKALPAEPAKVIEHPTGVTVGQVWAGLDDQAKRNYLIGADVQVWVMSNEDLLWATPQRASWLKGSPPPSFRPNGPEWSKRICPRRGGGWRPKGGAFSTPTTSTAS